MAVNIHLLTRKSTATVVFFSVCTSAIFFYCTNISQNDISFKTNENKHLPMTKSFARAAYRGLSNEYVQLYGAYDNVNNDYILKTTALPLREPSKQTAKKSQGHVTPETVLTSDEKIFTKIKLSNEELHETIRSQQLNETDYYSSDELEYGHGEIDLESRIDLEEAHGEINPESANNFQQISNDIYINNKERRADDGQSKGKHWNRQKELNMIAEELKNQRPSAYQSYRIDNQTQKSDQYFLDKYTKISIDAVIKRDVPTQNNSGTYYWTFYKSSFVSQLLDRIATADYSHVKSCPMDTFLAVFVHIRVSTQDNLRVMNSIRAEWERYLKASRERIQLYFLIGLYNLPEKATAQMLSASDIRRVARSPLRDVIQFPFAEHYLNLTLKTIAMVKWASMYCKSATYVLKIDDDAYVNIDALIKELHAIQELGIENVVLGSIGSSHKVPTSGVPFNTFHVDKRSYPLDMYPKYALGFFYVFTNDVTRKFLQRITMPTTPLIPIEDIYLTGIVRLSEEIDLLRMRSVFPLCLETGLDLHWLIAMHHYNSKVGHCVQARAHVQRNSTSVSKQHNIVNTAVVKPAPAHGGLF